MQAMQFLRGMRENHLLISRTNATIIVYIYVSFRSPYMQLT